MKTIKIGLLGLGTVGSGTVKVLSENAKDILRRTGHNIQVHHVAARQYDASRIVNINQIEKISDDVFDVVNDPEVDIVVELIGGYSPAKELILKAIENGKHVVTANKALIAVHGNEILSAAQKHNRRVGFEAAVAGGIPIIKVMREGLVANQIQWIAGIINGTNNFILTEMCQEGRDFNSALKTAQDLGYAEVDPTFDIEGIDAAHKLAILGFIAFGIPLQFKNIYIEGITKIEQQDMMFAAELGYSIKHLSIVRKKEKGIEMRVHPALIRQHCLMANVEGVMNALLVKGNAVGPTMYYGAGAGSEPTASAVIADVVDIARNFFNHADDRFSHLTLQQNELQDTPVLAITEIDSAYYLRLQALDQPGVLADIKIIFGDFGISIESIMQKPTAENAELVSTIILTQQVQEKNIDTAIEKIKSLPALSGEITCIRIESLE